MKADMQHLILIYVSLAMALVAAAAWWRRRRQGGELLPPGPAPLPIVGNIFQLGRSPHKSFARLAKTYGPLMTLRLGTQVNVIVTSTELAREVLRKQELVFRNVTIPDAIRAHGHDRISLMLQPTTSDRWKMFRRIGNENIFSNQALHATQALRHDALQKLVDHVGSHSGATMNVGEATFTAMVGLVFATIFSMDIAADSRLKEHVCGVTRYLGVPNISDFFPFLAPLDLQGIRRKMSLHLGWLLEMVGSMIEQRLQSRKKAAAAADRRRNNDFLETLLDLVEGNEYDLSIQDIKHLCVELIIGGTDTSAAATEWAMAELLLQPDKMAKLKAEMKSVIGEKRIVEEADISRLPYLEATVKEVLRYHPVGPLLAPHVAAEETKVNGYIIPKNTKMIVNYWAIARDPSIWNNPECFEPERFLGDTKIDYGGQHFELISFGSGRRMCIGKPLATRMLHCMVATLCHNFDWELEGGGGPEIEQFEREDVFGLALQKKNPLRAIPYHIK